LSGASRAGTVDALVNDDDSARRQQTTTARVVEEAKV
jgi:hypothetical protein